MTRCALCGWVLDAEHIFNVNCAVASAENDQIEAEVAEAQAQPVSPEEAEHLEHLVQNGLEILQDILALKRFERDCKPVLT